MQNAEGDVLSEGGIEEGGEVNADQGSILIGGPVVGRRAKLTALQDILGEGEPTPG